MSTKNEKDTKERKLGQYRSEKNRKIPTRFQLLKAEAIMNKRLIGLQLHFRLEDV